jgi:hypothetical protein
VADLLSCSCGGLIPPKSSACPHCGAATSRIASIAKKVIGVAAGGSVAVTLMACYGPPPRSMEDASKPVNTTSPADAVKDSGSAPVTPPASSDKH